MCGHDYSRCEIWRESMSDRIEIYFESDRDTKLTRRIYDWDSQPEDPEEPLFDYDNIPF